MIRNIFLLALVLLLAACEVVERGTIPTFTGFNATAIGASQIQLTWTATAGADDLIETENLVAGIWVEATSDGGLDPDALGTPNFITDEGALSWTLTELAAATEYDILVRIGDRNDAPIWSEIVDAKVVTTLATGGGLFGPAIQTTGIDDNVQIIAGRATSTTDSIGTVRTASGVITWYNLGTDGKLVKQTTGGLTIAGLREAVLVPVKATENDHLFALTDAGLSYYTNGTSLVKDEDETFDGIPTAGTFSYRLDGALLDVFAYVGDNSVGYIYEKSDSDVAGDPTFVGHEYNTTTTDPLLTVAKMDADAFYDVIYFADNKIYVDLAKDATLESSGFHGAVEIAALDADDIGTGGYLGFLFVQDGNNDGFQDIYIFIRNESADLTKMISFAGIGDGTFNDAVTANYNFHFYSSPVMTVAGNVDDKPDFVVPQTSSNNVAIYLGPSATFSGTPVYFGIDGDPSQALTANLDGLRSRELVILDQTNHTISVLISN